MTNLRWAKIAFAVVTSTLIGVVVYASLRPSGIEPNPLPPSQPPNSTPDCRESRGSGSALCEQRNVTQVIDGDTLVVEGNLHIRLVLVDAPELNAPGGSEARAVLASLCSGRSSLVDEDDFQVGGDSNGRILAVVRCEGTNANAAILASGVARTYHAFCPASEFGDEAWTGCSSPPPSSTCDPAYPGVCIPPPPPYLNCSDVPFRRFRVFSPDPHRFDRDGDGVGCEVG